MSLLKLSIKYAFNNTDMTFSSMRDYCRNKISTSLKLKPVFLDIQLYSTVFKTINTVLRLFLKRIAYSVLKRLLPLVSSLTWLDYIPFDYQMQFAIFCLFVCFLGKRSFPIRIFIEVLLFNIFLWKLLVWKFS